MHERSNVLGSMQHIEFKIQFPLNFLQIELKTVLGMTGKERSGHKWSIKRLIIKQNKNSIHSFEEHLQLQLYQGETHIKPTTLRTVLGKGGHQMRSFSNTALSQLSFPFIVNIQNRAERGRGWVLGAFYSLALFFTQVPLCLTLWWWRRPPFGERRCSLWGEKAPWFFSSRRFQKSNFTNWLIIILSLMYQIFLLQFTCKLFITNNSDNRIIGNRFPTKLMFKSNLISYFTLETCYNDIPCPKVLRNQDKIPQKQKIYISIALCV